MEGHQPAGAEEPASLTSILEKSLEGAGRPGESLAPRETLAASVRTVASQVVGSGLGFRMYLTTKQRRFSR